MALLDFTPIKLNAPAVKPADEYSEEFVAQYQDVLAYCLDNPDEGITVDFKIHKTREQWFKSAKNYGAGLDVPMTIRRVKGYDSMNKDHGQMTFVIERADAGEVRKAEREAAAERTSNVREWAQNQGIQVSAKGKIAKDVYAKYDAAH